MLCFAVRDIKAESFMTPFFEKHVSGAIRAFEFACNQKDSPYNLYPDDFELVQIGTFDTGNGDLKTSHNSLGIARTFIKQ